MIPVLKVTTVVMMPVLTIAMVKGKTENDSFG